jgi:hypothetical protein
MRCRGAEQYGEQGGGPSHGGLDSHCGVSILHNAHAIGEVAWPSRG